MIDLWQAWVTEMQQLMLELIHVPRYTYPDLKWRHNHLVYEEMLDGENYKGHTEGPFGFSIFLNLMGLVGCLNQLLAKTIAVLQASLTRFYSTVDSRIQGQRCLRTSIEPVEGRVASSIH